ncbi:MAG: HD domain-containing protein, partial [Dehalococcoidia bacterium]
PWQLLACDLKNGRGGLRDLHAVHWLDTAEAIARDVPPPALPPALVEVQERLLCTRNAVHALAERPNEFYRPEQARAVAEWLGVDSLEWGRALYAAMRVADAAVDEHLARAAEEERTTRWWRVWERRPATPAAASEAAPALAAVGSAALLGPSSTLEALLRVLRRTAPGGPLDPLPPSPALETLLPEWEVLRARPHIAPFHIHPVDVHVMRAVYEARCILEEDEYQAGTPEVARELDAPDEVLLAALLHDIGKGHGGDHPGVGTVITERFVVRAGLGPDVARRLVMAVRQHLLLPNVATRRDIADPAVIEETARRIGDAQTLRLLYLLSIADARASGPNVWSQWKAQLMRAFYSRLLGALAAEPEAAAVTPAEVAAALAGRFPGATVEAHLAGMDVDYLLSTPAETVGDHLALIEEAAGGTAVRHERLGQLDRLTVVTPDRPGLIQAIAGTLACHNANVLGGVAHTRADGVAVQVWHVTDTLEVGIDERRWQRILEAIPAAVEGAFPIDERLAEVRAAYPVTGRPNVPMAVHVDNTASRDYTVLEVSTADRRGLLYAVTKLLHGRAIDIHLAKVDTIGPEVVDAFYIRSEGGRRIDDPQEMAELRQAVLAALSALEA